MSHQAPHRSQAFPELLKNWRKKSRFSQLDLALEAGLSQRHVSFLETGRSKPSRYSIQQLGQAMNLPASEIDVLMLTAGFATRTNNRNWSEATRTAINSSIDHILASHNPYPAVAVDRIWNLQKANSAAGVFFQMLGHDGDPNMLRALLKPGKVRDSMNNWAEKIQSLMRLFELEVARRPNDHEAFELLQELKNLPDVNVALDLKTKEDPPPLLTMQFKLGENDITLFSMITTVGLSNDATLEDIRMETFFPADKPTEQWFQHNIAPHL
ncbi:helix-turn-helix domain-containing protein [Kiloniella sp. EL199]|uniref:helix-turn-helix domain-containing protein n=1 Tax=Kiloniella sp. EL199 TaxID=2107581 RepID=UPI000EA22CB9|nr:helix-turn-helix transcriptional regulator [Kiloniella sp. EL199]